MEVFIWMYVGLLMSWLASSHMPHKKSVNFAWISGFLILWLIQALRYEYIGTDLQIYIPFFINGNQEYSHFESGFVALNTILQSFTNDPHIFLATVSFITLFPISYIFKKYSTKISFTYIIFASFVVYHFTFSGLRQAVAIGIIVFSYVFVDKHKLIPFVVSVFIASLFHISSVVFIIYYPLCNWLKMTDKKFLLAIIIGFAVILVLKPILEIIVPLIFGEDKYIGYIQQNVVPAYNLTAVIFALFLFTFIVKYPSQELRNFRAAVFCAFMCQSLGLISEAAPRIGYYFIPFISLAVPQAISESNKSVLQKSIMTFGITAFMIFFFFYAYSGGYLEVVPYNFYWEYK